jgi:hypothetical protein
MSTGLAGALEDLRRNAAGELRDLRRNWGGAYEITGPPVWRAVRRDDQVTLIATGPGKLRDLITADYTARPVPRSLAAVPCRAAAAPAVLELHPLMPPAEVADAFGVDSRTVARWEDTGELDSVRLPSGIRRYFRAQVEALLRGEALTPEQVRALREELADRAQGRPMGCTGEDS